MWYNNWAGVFIMKTEAIKRSIVSHFKTISEKAKVTPTEEHIRPVWGLNYRKRGTQGFVSEFGLVERNGTEIDIVEGEVRQIKKPFWMTWKRALKKINKMMGNMEENLDNEKVVKKNTVNILCFPKDFAKRLAEKHQQG